jgi:hypothetical protein
MAAAKNTYKIILSNGKVETTKSVKEYTHAVCGIYKEEMPEQVFALCGSLELAEKQLAKWSGSATFIAAKKAYIVAVEKV